MTDAAALLQQIPSQPLSKLLSSLRKPTPLPSPLATLFRGLPVAQIIDVHGPSHTGKTHLLYHLVTQIILPDYFPGYTVRLSSSSSHAVFWIDCDGRLDIHRLRRVMGTYIKDRFFENRQGGFVSPNPVQEPVEEEVEEVVRSALEKLYVFQPTSGIGLLSIVKGLPTFLSRSENRYLTIGMICIDSLTAFHHILRPQDNLSEYYIKLASSLRSLATLFNVPVITTSWALYLRPLERTIQGRGYLGVGPSHFHSAAIHRPIWRQYFPVEWLRAVDRRIILQRKEIRGFLAGMLIVEAEMEREKRMEVVRKGGVMGWLEEDETRAFEMFIVDDAVRV